MLLDCGASLREVRIDPPYNLFHHAYSGLGYKEVSMNKFSKVKIVGCVL